MKYAILVIVLVILAYLIMDFNSRTAELNRLKIEKEVVSAQLASRQQTKSALEAQIAYATSDAAVVKWAYENHMARPGDIPVVPIQPDENAPQPTPRPTATIVQVSNFERWLSLFIDPPTP